MFFFFNDTATTEIYTLSLHDALPICLIVLVENGRLVGSRQVNAVFFVAGEHYPIDFPVLQIGVVGHGIGDRKSTRLNSSHANISYAVFCLKKKKDKHPLHIRVVTSVS